MPMITNDTVSRLLNLVHRANLDEVSDPPLSHAAFNLDSSGVAGFFGGESAVRATATVNLVSHRRWFGWYNAPGSYEVARQYSGLAKAHLFDALFPSGDSNPTKILMVDGRVGPEYTPLYSTVNTAPSTIEHLGSLIARKVSEMPIEEALSLQGKGAMEPPRVTFVTLNGRPPSKPSLSKLDLVSSSSVIIFGIITIFVNVGGLIGCSLVRDWFCLASIALGIVANGVACVVIGSGELYLKHNPPARVHTSGDVLLRTDRDIIVLVGDKGLVSPFTRGRFDLRFRAMPMFSTKRSQLASHDVAQPTPQAVDQPPLPSSPQSNPHPTVPLSRFLPTFSQPRVLQKYSIDVSVILLLSQFLAQLLLIPQGTLFGQVMFVGTLLASWIYNSYLSSLSLDLQTNMLFGNLSIVETRDLHQYELNNWTEAVIFACLFFRALHPLPSEAFYEDAMHNLERRKNKATTKLEKAEDAADAAQEALHSAKATVKALKEASTSKVKAAKAAEDAAASVSKYLEREVDHKRADLDLIKAEQKENEQKLTRVKGQAKKAVDSFQSLLDALLPDQTNALQAFKESLVRRIGQTDIDPFTDIPPTFKFEYQDTFVNAADRDGAISSRELVTLRTYQADAENALRAWIQFCHTTKIDISKLRNIYN